MIMRDRPRGREAASLCRDRQQLAAYPCAKKEIHMSMGKSSQTVVLCAFVALSATWVTGQDRPFVRGDVNQDDTVNIAGANY